jgi:AhpD family alkylhydroperoxidase
MAHYHDLITELREPTRELRHAIPETWAGFGELHERAVAPGRVPAHLKELIALAIAVSKECDGCIAYHARAAAAKGASREELAEVLGVTLLMGGGPASVYAPRAWAAFDEFAAQAAATP